MTHLLGIHHVTAIAGDPQRNLDFYAGVLGLRLVKRTVNFDDPQTYHLYYGDERGTPGGIMTFFPWPGAQRGRAGSRQVGVTSFAVLPAAFDFWRERLERLGVSHQRPITRQLGADAETVLAFHDPDGLALEIVAHPLAEARPAGAEMAGIASDQAIRGFHGVALWAAGVGPTERVLADTLGFRQIAEDEGVRRFEVGAGGVSTFVDVRAAGGIPRGVGGAGTVHHVAFRVADDSAQLAVREQVVAVGLHATEQVDRTYFRSVYFHEPGGVLFEIATDLPGFAVDEPVAELGRSLKLPPQYESHRAQIEAVLPAIHLPVPLGGALPLGDDTGPEDVSGEALGFVHRYVPPSDGTDPGATATLLLLHGTGGDENDLLPLGQLLLPGAGMLSPRGQVLEGDAPRFFRRHGEGVFDQEDLRARTEDLAEFIERSAATYGFDRHGVIAVGFSNGANIAASLLLRHGPVIRAAVLLSPMLPFEPDRSTALRGAAVFVGAGRHDPIVPGEQVERLATVLREAGADVTVHWSLGGHRITPGVVEAAREWLARLTASGRARVRTAAHA